MKEERVEELLTKCRRLLQQEGIPVSEKITHLTVNGRAKARFGQCRKTEDGYEIEISRNLLDCGEKEIETVLLHELLHTCPRCMNHGTLWKTYAAQMNLKYGYEISTRTSYEKLGLEHPASRETVKYLVVCTGCGQEIPRKRMCSLVKNIKNYRCGKCGGKLEIHPILLHLVDEK